MDLDVLNKLSFFEEKGLDSIQFNGKIIKMMLLTKFVGILTPRYLTFI